MSITARGGRPETSTSVLPPQQLFEESFGSEDFDECGYAVDFLPRLALRRLFDTHDRYMRIEIHTQCGDGNHLQRLLARFHNIGQRSKARLVESQISRDDRRQFEANGLESAIDFADDGGGLLIVADRYSRRVRRRRPLQQTGSI